MNLITKIIHFENANPVKILPTKSIGFSKENKNIMDFLNENFEYTFDYIDNFDSIDNSKLDLYSFIVFNNSTKN